MLKISLRVYLTFFISLIFVLGWMFSQSQQKIRSCEVAPIVDQLMRGVRLQRFNKEGHITQVTTMDSWFHHQGETVTEMVKPTLHIYHVHGQWEISALKGEGFQAEMGGQLEKLHLADHVVIYRQGNNAHDWWQLKTEQIMFFPHQAIALTDDPVSIYSEGAQIHATGMRAYLDRHYIELLKDVDSHYAKPQT